ncbi:transcriptional regulator, IclR family [Rhodococcus wratislaviensis]|uniref:Transcriptional regulator, IclR family n=1 Tax=Rhodococcus wratislaviensis TaxID=44752 RepID=A0A402C5M2_RHOWR|nr:IclR family transcriptional regulator [Rhodococcus wratislaviensis]GCE38858.1 transcriptional regulator, IclR family [Rhodococcus wratislaviensis]
MRTVKTTFQILEAVGEQQPIGLSELARRLDLPKSTVQRSLATLADLGWIRVNGRESAGWRLGEKVRALREKVDHLGRLRDAALPILGQLNGETLETIHLAVAENRTMRLVERMDSKHALRLVQPIGTRSPLHATSTGKSVLAYLPDQEVESYLNHGLNSLTSRTITDPEGLRAQLESIRDKGFAISDEELSNGTVSVAASVRPGGGRPIAAVSISGPTVRMSPEVHRAYGKLVAAATCEIASQLEY